MLKFKMTVYPDSNCESNLTITIGTLNEIAPDQLNYDGATTFGYLIETPNGGESHHGFKTRSHAEAKALLRAAAYGNGGFPLDSMLR